MKRSGGSHRCQVFFGRTAAPADQADVVANELGHDFGQIGRAHRLMSMNADSGLHEQRDVGLLPEAAGEGEHGASTGLTVDPEDGRAAFDQAPGRRTGRIGPFPEADEDRDRRAGRRDHFVEHRLDVGKPEGFKQQGIDAFAHQDDSLLRSRAFFFSGFWSDRTQNKAVEPAVGPGQLNRPAIDGFELRHLVEPDQARAIGAEGVGENSIGTGRAVALVDLGDDLGMTQAPEGGVVAFQVESGGDESGAHGGVEQQGTVLELLENRRTRPRVMGRGVRGGQASVGAEAPGSV